MRGGRQGVGGDRACQSAGMTDRRAVGTGDRGHPGPSWANMGGLLWVYQTADPPRHPAQETGRQMNGEIVSMKRTASGTSGRAGVTCMEGGEGWGRG